MENIPRNLPLEIYGHYQIINEENRLNKNAGLLEKLRTQEIIKQYLPPAPATILDVGGAAGVYALWLAKLGYRVHLIDPVQLHVEQARQASIRQTDYPLASVEIGDARKLNWDNDTFEAVLLLGPLYHLTEREERVGALRECLRVLKPGGVLFAAVISRYASVFDGLFKNFLDDPQFEKIVEQDLSNGQHRNPTNHPAYFTTSFFHLSTDLESEIKEAGLQHTATIAVEGPGWLLPDLDKRLENNQKREQILEYLAKIEQEPNLLGISAHLVAVAYK